MKLIIGNKLVLSDQETPDKIPEHYIDAGFHVQSEYCIYSDQFPTIHDIIHDFQNQIMRVSCDDQQGYHCSGSKRMRPWNTLLVHLLQINQFRFKFWKMEPFLSHL